MTACLYMKPKGYPLLLSDTIVTRETDDLDDLNVPGALVRGTKIAKFKSTHTSRKIYLFGNHLALACAGTVEEIEKFLHEILELGDDLSNVSCMDKVYNILHKYEADVNTIACFQSRKESCTIVPDKSRYEIEGYFEYFTIGSGEEELARIVRRDFEFYEKIQWDVRKHWEVMDDYNLISNFAGRICSRMIGNELLYGYGKDWGGFAEWAYYNYGEDKWCYAPKTLHCFILALPLPNKRFTLEQSRYWYCYKNNEQLDNSEVVGFRMVNEIQAYQWSLENILSYDMGRELNLSEWTDWKPSEIVVQLFPYGKVDLEPLLTVKGNFLGRDFSIKKNSIVAQIPQESIDLSGQVVGRLWGLEYVPMASLTDAQMEEAFIAAVSGGWDK